MLPVYSPIKHLPAPPTLYPTLRLAADAQRPDEHRAYFTRTLVEQLGLKANQPIDLLPPGGRHNWWHLDLRPQAMNRLRWYKDTRPRIHGLLLPPELVADSSALILRLVPGDPPFPGFYPMLPDAYFTQHAPPPLAASLY